MERPELLQEAGISQLEFPGDIFKIQTDAGGNRLALEVRQQASSGPAKLLYYMVQLPEGKILGQSEPSEWWSDLVAVQGDFIVVHRYADKELPVVEGVEIRRSPDFELVWSHAKAKFHGIDGDRMLMEVDSGLGFHWSWDPQVNACAIQEVSLPSHHQPQFPQLRHPEMAPVTQWPIRDLLEEYPPLLAVGHHLSLEIQDLYAWHSAGEAGHDLFLSCSSGGESQWTICLADALPQLSPEPFFLYDKTVIWLAGMNQLRWRQLD